VEKTYRRRSWIFARRRPDQTPGIPGPRPRDIKRPEHWNDW